VKRLAPRGAVIISVVLWSAVAAAKPVLIAETAGKTRYYADDTTVQDLPSAAGPIRQVQIRPERLSPLGAQAGQVATEGVMQFRCALRQYRQVQTTAINRDGSRQEVVPHSTTRPFTQTAPGRFEHVVLEAVCRMKP
jgi:hypothetical protein